VELRPGAKIQADGASLPAPTDRLKQTAAQIGCESAVWFK
jgi:sulfur transfer protein SufE